MDGLELRKLKKDMIRLQGGDINALESIYELTRRGVFSFVLPILRDYDKAEDIMQQTYVQIYEKIDQYDKSKNPQNWILTIAKNLALNEINKDNRELSTDFMDAVNGDKVFSFDRNEYDTPTIDLANKILTPSEFQIVMLFAVGEYKHREIAEILDLPLGTVTWKYSSAINKLKKALKEGNYER